MVSDFCPHFAANYPQRKKLLSVILHTENTKQTFNNGIVAEATVK